MQINEIMWLSDIVEKIEMKHSIVKEDVEQVLHGRPMFRRAGRSRRNPREPIYHSFGQTGEGKYIFVAFILKSGNSAFVLTAREMTKKERRAYVRSAR